MPPRINQPHNTFYLSVQQLLDKSILSTRVAALFIEISFLFSVYYYYYYYIFLSPAFDMLKSFCLFVSSKTTNLENSSMSKNIIILYCIIIYYYTGLFIVAGLPVSTVQQVRYSLCSEFPMVILI